MAYYKYRLSFVLLFLSLSCGQAQALSSDSEQPLTIKAAHASIDDQKGITIYRGNVEVQQGSMRIYADTVTLSYHHEQGERTLQTVIAEGNLARFRQRPDNRDEDIEAQSKRMEYYVPKALLHLMDNAQVRQGQDTFSGSYIVYDSRSGVLTAGSDEGKSSGQRIEATFHPRKSPPLKPHDTSDSAPSTEKQ